MIILFTRTQSSSQHLSLALKACHTDTLHLKMYKLSWRETCTTTVSKILWEILQKWLLACFWATMCLFWVLPATATVCRISKVTRLHVSLKRCMENIFSSGSSIYYPCWQTAWCGCGTGFADVAVGTCPGICSSMRVSQSPSWWPQPWWEFPLWSPPTTRYLSSSGNKSSWIWYQCR